MHTWKHINQVNDHQHHIYRPSGALFVLLSAMHKRHICGECVSVDDGAQRINIVTHNKYKYLGLAENPLMHDMHICSYVVRRDFISLLFHALYWVRTRCTITAAEWIVFYYLQLDEQSQRLDISRQCVCSVLTAKPVVPNERVSNEMPHPVRARCKVFVCGSGEPSASIKSAYLWNKNGVWSSSVLCNNSDGNRVELWSIRLIEWSTVPPVQIWSSSSSSCFAFKFKVK